MNCSISLFNVIYTFVGYLIPKPSLEKSNDTIKPIAEEGFKGVHTFPNIISSKMNAVVQ